jgi:hypothetical protein
MRKEPARGTLDRGTAFICTSNGFGESVSQLLLGAGYRAPERDRALRPDGLTAAVRL